MKRLVPILLAVCMLLCGCEWPDGRYHRVTPHQQPSAEEDSQVEVAENYLQLRTALENMINDGAERSVISVTDFLRNKLSDSMDMAIRYVKNSHPLGAYAVEDITYEVGNIGGSSAVAVEITYLHGRSELQRIQQVAGMEQAEELIAAALTDFDTKLVMLIDDYQLADIHQWVDDFAAANPSVVMETPEITLQLYPESGRQRIMELKFTYQSSRDSLRVMRDRVQRVFDSAALYVSHDAQDARKLSQLYAFLMERFDSYQVKTSLTPPYSLLNHGVGDSAAFAEVYAEMCRRAGVECLVVVGTRNGEPWCWNIVQDEGYYFHVDLLECQSRGGFRSMTDAQMGDYVWDYSAYPACTGRPIIEAPEETTEPAGENVPEEDSTKP
jgi:hypothetical protein